MNTAAAIHKDRQSPDGQECPSTFVDGQGGAELSTRRVLVEARTALKVLHDDERGRENSVIHDRGSKSPDREWRGVKGRGCGRGSAVQCCAGVRGRGCFDMSSA